MTTYKGVKITGTSTTAKAFPKSGVSNAKVGDYYLNTSTGHRYYCSTKGNPSDARWRYNDTPINGIPDIAPTKMTAPKRGSGYTFSSTWEIPKKLTAETNPHRGTKLTFIAEVAFAQGSKQNRISRVSGLAISAKSGSANLNSFKAGKDTYTRQSFWPYTDRKITEIAFVVYPANKIGSGNNFAGLSTKVSEPKPPTLSAATIDQNGIVSCTITPAANDGARERLRTQYEIEVLDSSAGSTWEAVETGYITGDSASTKSYDVQNWQVAGKYVQVRFRARSQGWGGDSAWTSYKQHVVGWPAETTISSISIFSENVTDIATINLTTNSASTSPSDQIRLMILKSTDIDNEAEAILSDEWDSTDSVDNAKSKALSCTIDQLMPERGKHTWVRVKSWHDIEGIFYVYSKPVEVTQLYKPLTTASDEIKIISASKGADGTRAVVLVAWNKDGADNYDGTELSWSDDKDAWRSNVPPSTLDCTESDGEYVDESVSPSVTYHDSRTSVLKDLKEGAPLYVKARRYSDDGASRVYGPYSEVETVIPSLAASSVVLKAEPYVAAGSDVPFSWVFAGTGEQTAWEIDRVSDGSFVDGGNGPLCFASVDAEQAADKAENGILNVYVAVSTGSERVSSDPVKVAIVEPPAISVSVSDLAAQPLSFVVTCSSSTCGIAAGVIANGSNGERATKREAQLEGDTVWTDFIESPLWSASGSVYAATVTLPEGADFRDGASYELRVQAVESQTGLRSEEAVAGFTVDWERKAVEPPDTIEVEAEVIDDDGVIRRIASISLAPPTLDASGEAYDDTAGDVYDIYRVTGDGAQLIGESYPLDAVAVDEYAPFGEATHLYRIVLRTVDGDTEWADYDYYLEGGCLRFDFDGESHSYVELPWDVVVSDSYAKDFASIRKMDGTTDGAWGNGIDRDSQLEAKIIRFDEAEDADAVRDLARCPSAVYVRTQIGTAFVANVDVSPIKLEEGVLFACTINAHEVGMTDRFMLPPIEEEEGNG